MQPRPVGRRALLAASYFLLTMAAGAASYSRHFLGGESYEFCHYSEIASNLLSGRGFSTRTYYPATLAHFAALGVEPGVSGPVVDRFPLQAAAVALMQAVLGRSDAATVAANVVAHAAWAGLIFWAGAAFFSVRAGAAAAALWALNPVMLVGYDLHGFADVQFGLLLLALNVVFFRWLEDGRRPGPAFAAGLLAGLCYLSRYTFVIFLPAYLLLPLLTGGARRHRSGPALILAGFLALALPWALANRSVFSGSAPPLLLWHMAGGTIGGALPVGDYRTWSLADFDRPGIAGMFVWKWLGNLGRFMADWPFFWKLAPVFPFAVLGLWMLPEGPGRRFLRFYAGLLAWSVFVFSFLRYEKMGFMDGRYYLWSAPALLLSATASIDEVAGARRPRWRPWLAAGLPAAVLCWWAGFLPVLPTRSDHPSGLRVGDWPEVAAMKGQGDGWTVTNIPTQLAWYAGLKTISIPNDPVSVGTIAKDYEVSSVYLSFHRIGEPGNYPAWSRLLAERGGVGRFCKEQGFEVERQDASGILLRKVR